MEFKEASDTLGVPAAQLADEFGLTPQTVRQMRADPDSSSYRTPPSNWREVVIRLAEQRIEQLRNLVAELRR